MSASAEADAESRAMEAEYHQMQLDRQRENERIYLYLERHIAPRDIPWVRERFEMPSEPRNTAQMRLEMACAGDN